MTDREKAVVMAYTGFAMLTGEKLGIFYAYVREILGRPVWTHELAIKEVSAEIHEKSEEDFLELCASEDPKELPCQDETGMDERAVKVCNGLNCHVNGHPHTRCHKCPYWGTGPHGSSECSALAADALTLIRQQAEKIHELQTKVHELQTVRTASVMTLEEVKAIPLKRDHVWVERLVKECYREVFGKTTLFCLQKLEHFGYEDDPDDGGPSEGVFWITPTKQFYKTRWDEYGKSFVCWTFKPTDEQMEAVKWE